MIPFPSARRTPTGSSRRRAEFTRAISCDPLPTGDLRIANCRDKRRGFAVILDFTLSTCFARFARSVVGVADLHIAAEARKREFISISFEMAGRDVTIPSRHRPFRTLRTRPTEYQTHQSIDEGRPTLHPCAGPAAPDDHDLLWKLPHCCRTGLAHLPENGPRLTSLADVIHWTGKDKEARLSSGVPNRA